MICLWLPSHPMCSLPSKSTASISCLALISQTLLLPLESTTFKPPLKCISSQKYFLTNTTCLGHLSGSQTPWPHSTLQYRNYPQYSWCFFFVFCLFWSFSPLGCWGYISLLYPQSQAQCLAHRGIHVWSMNQQMAATVIWPCPQNPLFRPWELSSTYPPDT